jgi:hypothetical protein
MKKLLKKTLLAVTTLLCVFVIGICPVMIISLFIVMTTPATLFDCITSVPFILFGVIGIIISAIFVNEEIINN